MVQKISRDRIPQELVYANSEITLKAVDMANDMLENGLDRLTAVAIAQSRIETWVDPAIGATTVHLIPHADGWQLVGAGNGEPGTVTSTKQKGLDAAKKYANEKKYRLVVHRQDGTVMEEHDYRA